jgi:cytochrome c biogenesis protein
VINVENFGGADKSGADARKVDLRASLDAQLGAANKSATKKELRNVGPSVSYKLRDAAGQAREFHNYMLPWTWARACRCSCWACATPGRELPLPARAGRRQGGIDGFLRCAPRWRPALREQAVRRYARKATDPARPELAQQLAPRRPRAGAVRRRRAGAGKAGRACRRCPIHGGQRAEAERARAGEVLVRILNGALFELAQLTRETAGCSRCRATRRRQAFMTQAVLALSDVNCYPGHGVPAAGLQAGPARVPGTRARAMPSLLGCALLILVFALLYVAERRVWVWLAPREAPEAPWRCRATARPGSDANSPAQGH